MATKYDRYNSRYIAAHGPLDYTAEAKADAIAQLIEKRSNGLSPQPGDIVVVHGVGYNGDSPVSYPHGHIEDIGDGSENSWVDKGQANICVEPYNPFVYEDGDMDTSGGYWLGAPINELIVVGTAQKFFWTWAGLPQGDGGIYFPATVHVWEYEGGTKVY